MLKRPLTVAHYWPIIRALLVVGGLLTVLIALVRWGGTARSGPIFVAGVALLTSLILLFGLFIAWIFSAPRPAARTSTLAQSELRQTIAVLGLISTTSFLIGIFWDEMWHRRLGGFGDDFWWPPHLMLYGSIALFMVFAASGLWIAVRGGGTLRARLRAESQLSLIGLIALFLIVSLPSDELWHRIYGKDITAWSLPHLTLAFGVTLIALSAAGLALASTPRQADWRDLRKLQGTEILALLLVTVAGVLLIQFGTSEWEGVRELRPEGGVFRDTFWLRPQWLYPVVVVTVALFISNTVLHLVRCAGAATVVALLVLGFRVVCLTALGDETEELGVNYTAHLLLLAPALLLDGWYLLRKRRADTLVTLIGGNLLAAAAFLVVALPLIDRMMIYPPINAYTVPRMVAMCLIMALAAGWTGARFGGWLSLLERSATSIPIRRRIVIVTLAGCSIAALVTISIMLTAEAPVSFGLR